MKVMFYGGRQSGMIVLLSILAKKIEVCYVIPEDDIVRTVADQFNIKIIEKGQVNDKIVADIVKKDKIDLFVCCHGKRIIKDNILGSCECINVHPCLYKYKGAEPISRLIKDDNTKASVAVHKMTDKVDDGDVMIELFKDVELDSVVSVYNQLYS